MTCPSKYYGQIGRVDIPLMGFLGGTGKRYALGSAKPSDGPCLQHGVFLNSYFRFVFRVVVTRSRRRHRARRMERWVRCGGRRPQSLPTLLCEKKGEKSPKKSPKKPFYFITRRLFVIIVRFRRTFLVTTRVIRVIVLLVSP